MPDVGPERYGETDQMPTLGTIYTVELEGSMNKLPQKAVIVQIDALSAGQRALFEKDAGKMLKGRFKNMLIGITGFTLKMKTWRNTIKTGRNKSAEAVENSADAIDAHGRPAIAYWIFNLPV